MVQVYAFIYARISSEGQNNLPGHTSLESQIQGCQEYCQQQGWQVRGAWQEIGSASGDMSRLKVQSEVFKEAKLLRKRFYGQQRDTRVIVVFYNITRFSRNVFQGLKLIHDLKSDGIEVFSVVEQCDFSTTAKKHLFRTTLCVAENESDQISDRVNRSIDYRRRRGDVFGPAPYGKKAIRRPDGARKFVNSVEEMQIIDTVLSKHYDGSECCDIATWLNDNRIRKRGKEWSCNMVNGVIAGHAHLRTRNMLSVIEDIEDFAESSSESESESESEQPIAKRVRRDIRQRSRSRSPSRRGGNLQFKGGANRK